MFCPGHKLGNQTSASLGRLPFFQQRAPNFEGPQLAHQRRKGKASQKPKDWPVFLLLGFLEFDSSKVVLNAFWHSPFASLLSFCAHQHSAFFCPVSASLSGKRQNVAKAAGTMQQMSCTQLIVW